METLPEKKSSSELQTDSSEIRLYNLQVVNLDKHSPKIRDFDKGNMDELENRLLAMIYSLGFKNEVEEEVIQQMGAFIKEEFGHLTLGDLALAFQKTLANKLGIKTKHYQNFDMQYLGEVCSAYSTWRTEQLKLAEDDEKEKREQEEIDKLKDVPAATGKDWYEMIERCIGANKKLPVFANWNLAYKYAESIGLIKHTAEEKQKIIEDVTKTIHEEISTQYAYNGPKSLGQYCEITLGRSEDLKLALKDENVLGTECRTRFLKQYLVDKMKDE